MILYCTLIKHTENARYKYFEKKNGASCFSK